MDQRIFSVLKELEKQVAAGSGSGGKKFWNVSPQTGNFLNMLVRSVRARAVLEIGTSNGYSGIWFAEALSHTGGKLYTVESHKERFALATEHFKEAGVMEQVEQIFGHAPEIFHEDDFMNRGLMFDLIFLDATKMEYASYLETVLPYLRVNGLLVADNVISHRRVVKDFLAAVGALGEGVGITDYELLITNGGVVEQPFLEAPGAPAHENVVSGEKAFTQQKGKLQSVELPLGSGLLLCLKLA